MKSASEIRRENLIYLISEFGSITKLADTLDRSHPQISQLKNGAKDSKTGKSRSIGDEMARHIERVCDKPYGWMDKDHSQDQGSKDDYRAPGAPSKEDYALIPQCTSKGSCGAGYHNDHVEVTEGLVFKKSWIAKMGLKESNLCVIYADGDSMNPYIFSGDVVLLDESQTTPKDNHVYAILRDNSEVVIKRLIKQWSGGWIIRSDNPEKTKWPDQEITDELAERLKIIGLVVWRGGAM